MKKFRGKRRYFRNLWREVTVDNYNLQFDNEAWFDLWHTHLDFSGIGNKSLKLRREHIKAHLALYKNLLKKLELLDKSYQTWILLDDEDVSTDAVFIHTPNPNENNFPLKVENLNWNCTIPTSFKDLIDTKEFNVGHYMSKNEGGYIIQSKNQGYNL